MPWINRHPDGTIKDLFTNCQFDGQECIIPNGPEHQAWKHAQIKADADRKAKADSWTQRVRDAKSMDELKALLLERL